ncbi:hypothetical protein AS026_33900 [Rhizobium altiplani]|uniref:Uncharacterized protein n=1 Tax=Rhizobium altiplani TaxID=1864509 RepID=A0A120FP79_9HYPH|nr:hypothetical protein AS026_33900 [Rhizobium altiplani]
MTNRWAKVSIFMKASIVDFGCSDRPEAAAKHEIFRATSCTRRKLSKAARRLLVSLMPPNRIITDKRRAGEAELVLF